MCIIFIQKNLCLRFRGIIEYEYEFGWNKNTRKYKHAKFINSYQ